MVVDETRRPVALDFFCGAGGMTLGFEQAGFDVIASFDNDPHHVATHRRNFPHFPSFLVDINDIDVDFILNITEGKKIDLFFGGPPCQGFSSMGLRDRLDPRNSLPVKLATLVAGVQPSAFVMENVPGMIRGEMKTVLNQVIKILEKNGYQVTKPVRMLNALDFGVPQDRKRVFLLATSSDAGTGIPYPIPREERVTVRDAISDLPDVDRYDSLFQGNEIEYDKEPRTGYAKLMRCAEADPSDRSRDRIWNERTCSGCIRTRHARKTVNLYKTVKQGEMAPSHRLPRLEMDGYCPTLRAGSDSKRGSHTAPRPIHPIMPRVITIREAARLHGYPDWFGFYPVKWHAHRQIGNSVCPPIAKAIGVSVLKALGIEPKKPPESIDLDDKFMLPVTSGNREKRHSFIDTFKPIIDELFSTRYDVVKKEIPMQVASFSHDDVIETASQLGINGLWTREDNFVGEISRYRNVNGLLENCLKKGYSLKEGDVAKGFAGTFVKKDDVQAIHDARAARKQIKLDRYG